MFFQDVLTERWGVAWGMDNALNAVLFAEDLLDYVLRILGYKWTCENCARNLPPGSAKKRFTPVFGEAVIEVISFNIDTITKCYQDLIKSGVKDPDDYRRELVISATHHFTRGYYPEDYITFSAMVTGISVFYFASGNKRMVEVSVQMLAYVMNFYIYHHDMKPFSDWLHLFEEGQEMRRSIEDKTIEFVLPVLPNSSRSL